MKGFNSGRPGERNGPARTSLNGIRFLIVNLLFCVAGSVQAQIVQFGSPAVNFREGAGAVQIDVLNPGAGPVTVAFTVTPGTASLAEDFAVATAGLLDFVDGQTSLPIRFSIVDDQFVEGNETFTVSLAAAQAGVIAVGEPGITTVTIFDDDPSPGSTAAVVSGGNQAGQVGDVLQPFALRVTTAKGEPVAGNPVAWSVSPADAGVITASTLTDQNGTTSNSLVLTRSDIGIVTVTAVAQSTGTLQFVVDTGGDGIPPAANVNVVSVSGDLQSGAPGATLNPFAFQLTDLQGAPAAGLPVAWSVLPTNAGTLASASTTTGTDGAASNTFTLGAAGPAIVEASVGGAVIRFLINQVIPSVPGSESLVNDIGGVLNGACLALANDGSAGGGLSDICAAVGQLQGATLNAALQEMASRQSIALASATVEASGAQTTNITTRLSNLHSGGSAFSAANLALRYGDMSLPASLLVDLFVDGAGGGAGSDDGAAGFGGKFGAFLNGNVSFGDQDSTANELGFDFDTQGVTGGLDYRLTPNSVLGLALGYVARTVDFAGADGGTDLEGLSLSAYGTWFQSARLYVDGIVRVGFNDYELTRNISFPGVTRTVAGETDGTEYAASVGAGYDFNLGGLTLQPYGQLNYVAADIDGYRERPAGGLELTVGSQDVTSATTTLGGQAVYAFNTRRGVFSPQLRFEWVYELEDDSRAITAGFSQDPGNGRFLIPTDAEDSSFFNLGLGMAAAFTHGRSAFVYFESVLAKEHLTQYSISAGYRHEF